MTTHASRTSACHIVQGQLSPVVALDVEAVLFDMDGTLVDSTQVVETLWAEFSDRYGVPLSDVLAYSHGRQTRDTVYQFLPPGIDPAPVIAKFHALEMDRVDGITEIPGAQRLLESLRRARVALVTSAPRALAARRMAAAGLDVPEVLITGDAVPVGKPDPTGYLDAARLLGVAPSRCLALEDAEAGVRAAIAAGAHTLVVGTHSPRVAQDLDHVPDLRAVGADVSLDGTTVRVQWPCLPR